MTEEIGRETGLPGVRALGRKARRAFDFLLFTGESEMGMAPRLAHWAKQQPDHPFIVFEGRQITYQQADDDVTRRASVLARFGVKKGDTVVLAMPNRPEFVLDALALNRLGAVAALINSEIRGRGLRHAVQIAKPIACIVGESLISRFSKLLQDDRFTTEAPLTVFVDWEGAPDPDLAISDAIDLRAEAAKVCHPSIPTVENLGTDLAALIYTSGTTGLPKAGNIINARIGMAAVAFGGVALGLGHWDIVYCCLPLFHATGFMVSLGCVVYNGATLALAREFSVQRFWLEVLETRATVFVYIGEVCRYLISQPESDLDGVHRLRTIIGNGMRPDVWRVFEKRFKPGKIREFYGATEGNVNMINLRGRFGSVGKVAPLLRLRNAILVRFDPETQQPTRDKKGFCIRCKRGEVGELLGKIDTKKVNRRFDGYADRVGNESKILRNVKKRGDMYFRSGDLLRQDWRGYYYFVDRIGDTFRWKGENVSTCEVGDIVQTDPNIQMATVYGVKVVGCDGRVGMVALLLTEGSTFDARAFYRHVSSELPAFAQPAFVRIAERLDLTETFKLKKVELVRQGFDLAEVSDAIYYRDDKSPQYLPLTPKVLEQISSGEIRF